MDENPNSNASYGHDAPILKTITIIEERKAWAEKVMELEEKEGMSELHPDGIPDEQYAKRWLDLYGKQSEVEEPQANGYPNINDYKFDSCWKKKYSYAFDKKKDILNIPTVHSTTLKYINTLLRRWSEKVVSLETRKHPTKIRLKYCYF